MNVSRITIALWIVFTAMGCGQQLVQFGNTDLASSVDAAVDFAIADLAGTPDLWHAADLATVPDLQAPDLLMLDLAMPDLATPDLAIADLSMPDLAVPDLLAPDLSMPDGGPGNPGPLGTLESYAIVASATITNVGPSTIIGSIGLEPGPMITGIPMGMPINGSIHVADGAAAKAQMDLTFVYNFMAAKPCGVNLTGMDLGGLTLAPGVYCFNINAGMAIGSTLILDAQGDPNAAWTFQIASTLILGDFAKIHVINGGRDCSVYWQVGSSATLGTGSRVAGSLLAQASITMVKGASVGRALARTGGVTMDTNDVAVGPCR